MEKKKRNKKEMGITLIALIITIIIMLILAGISISVLVSEDGIFDRVQQAAEEYEKSSQEEGSFIDRLVGFFGKDITKSIKYEIDKLSDFGTTKVLFKINMSDGIKSIVINGMLRDLEEGAKEINFEYDATLLTELAINVTTMKDENITETIVIPENQYDISTAEQLWAFARKVNSDENASNFEGKIINIIADIDLGARQNEDGTWTEEVWIPIGNTTDKAFAGTLNGNNHVIKGMYVNAQDTNAGLFGNNKGVIKDLGVVDSYVYSNNTINNIDGQEDATADKYISVGAIVGKNFENGQIINCYNESEVKIESSSNTCSTIGGIAGLNISGGVVEDCYNTGNIEGTSTAKYFMQGGIAGTNEGGAIKECNNQGEIKQVQVATSANDNLGGVVGFSFSGGNIEECYNEGNIIYDTKSAISYIGGVIGRVQGNSTAKNCGNSGLLNGNVNCSDGLRIGGAVGANHNNSIINTLTNTGNITGNIVSANQLFVGGALGFNYNNSSFSNGINEGTIKLDSITTAELYLGGVLALNNSSNLTDAENFRNIDISVNVSKSLNIGGVVGWNNKEIKNVCNEGNIKVVGNKVVEYVRFGGVVGNHQTATAKIINSCNKGDIDFNINATGNSCVGGIVGINYNGATINSSYNIGNIAYTSSGRVLWLGGVAGDNELKSSIRYCYNRGNIDGTASNTTYIGISGIIGSGYETATLSNCYSTGTVKSNKTNNIAGIVGYNFSGTVSNSYYLTGSVSRAYVSNTGTIQTSSAKSDTDMKKLEFVTTMSSTYFKEDVNNKNDGYPLLMWQSVE